MDDEVYVFDLKMICGGSAYFSTYTLHKGFGESGREYRTPSMVSKSRFTDLAKILGHNPNLITNAEQLSLWFHVKGWAIIEKEFVRQSMSKWLKHRECLASPIGVFTDVKLVSPSVLQRMCRGKKKKAIVERDDAKCLDCGNDNDLTMQHVIPYSKGGETSASNLVTLCEPCNQKYSDRVVFGLFDAAGLHYNYDKSLINDIRFSAEQKIKAIELSKNLMQTKCEVW